MRLTLSLTMLMMGLVLRTAIVGAMEKKEHRIMPGDTVEVNVEPQCQFACTTIVSSNGEIRLPFAGALTATGLTADELAERLHGELSRGLVDPRVAVSVKQPFWPCVPGASTPCLEPATRGTDGPR